MNDIDLWQDIEELFRLGDNEHADSLFKIFHYRYTEHNPKELEKAKEEHYKKYKYTPNIKEK